MATTPQSRRTFLKSSLGAAVAVGFPTIVPSSVFGQDAPSNRINIGAIGVGRISRVHDMPGVWKYTSGARNNRILAVCDLYAPRVEQGKQLLNGVYTQQTGKDYTATIGYSDYRELLANREIDAVIISTPDHQHARLAVAAVRARKDVYLQKPASLTISEGRFMSDHVMSSGQILQIGSQQRSWKQFHRACELVRNGRIGDIQHVEIGLPGDPSGGNPDKMPIPAGFNYDAWLGSTPEVYYTVDRVMPQQGFDRPGWLRMEQFGAGMITGWGAHHVDTAHWGMNTEHTGPIEVWGTAEFPTHGLWDVHGPFKTDAVYANGITMSISGDYPNGIKWIGTKGWIFVTRDATGQPHRYRSRQGQRRSTPRQRSQHSLERDRSQRSSPLYQRRPAWKLARLHPQPSGPHGHRGAWPSRLLHLPRPSHRDEDEAQTSLGPCEGALPQRRRSQQHALTSATRTLHPQLICVTARVHLADAMASTRYHRNVFLWNGATPSS